MEDLEDRINLEAVLTPRQEEISRLVALGHSMKEIADILGISYKTVDSTMQSLYRRTGATKATEVSLFYFCRRFKIAISSLLIVSFLMNLFNSYEPDWYLRRKPNTRIELIVTSRRPRHD